MTEGFYVSGKHSFRDFDIYLSARDVGFPDKKIVRETVPYMNGYYDFSKSNGALIWGSRVLKYKFEIAESSIAEMDRQRSSIMAWLMEVHEQELVDDTLPGYHFIASYENYSMTEDGEYCEIEVSFNCYPFRIANEPTEYNFSALGTFEIVNPGQRVSFECESTTGVTITINGVSEIFTSGKHNSKKLFLNNGTNNITITAPCAVRFHREVL